MEAQERSLLLLYAPVGANLFAWPQSDNSAMLHGMTQNDSGVYLGMLFILTA